MDDMNGDLPCSERFSREKNQQPLLTEVMGVKQSARVPLIPGLDSFSLLSEYSFRVISFIPQHPLLPGWGMFPAQDYIYVRLEVFPLDLST